MRAGTAEDACSTIIFLGPLLDTEPYQMILSDCSAMTFIYDIT